MSTEFGRGTEPDERSRVTTIDELALHLREAGAKRVFLSRADAFRTGSIPIVATYEYRDVGSGGAAIREMLVRVFESIGDRVWFEADEWPLEWEVEPALSEPRMDLLALYDRNVERKHGDGFNLRSVRFVYEQYVEMESS